MKTKSTYLQSYKQIEAPGTLQKHLTVYQNQSDIFHPVLKKQQNRVFCLKNRNSLHCFIIRVQIRHMIFLWYT